MRVRRPQRLLEEIAVLAESPGLAAAAVAFRVADPALALVVVRLAVDAAQLEARVAKGEFNRSTTKVLHLRHNPTSLSLDAKLEALQRENAKVPLFLPSHPHYARALLLELA